MKYVKKAAFITLMLPLILLLSYVCSVLFSAKIILATSLLAIVFMIVMNCEDSCDLFEKRLDFDFPFSENDSEQVTAYIINMDSAKERLKYVQDQVKKLKIPHKRIAAVDGNKIKNMEEIVDIESYKAFFKMLPEPGTIGCFLSHEKAWRSFLESGDEFALVFEDDVSFNPEELQEMIGRLIKHKHLWDIVGLELLHDGNPLKLITLSIRSSLCIYLTQVTHAGAYLINRKAALALLEKMYPIKMPVDHYITLSWEFGTKFCGIEPRFVHQKFGDSQIKVGEPQKLSFGDMLGEDLLLTHFVYHFYTSAMKTLYNMYTYIFHSFGF